MQGVDAGNSGVDAGNTGVDAGIKPGISNWTVHTTDANTGGMQPACDRKQAAYHRMLRAYDRMQDAYDRMQGLNCQKISGGGLTSAYSLSLSLHTGNSASLTTAGGG
jgi:hypothetical protein